MGVTVRDFIRYATHIHVLHAWVVWLYVNHVKVGGFCKWIVSEDLFCGINCG